MIDFHYSDDFADPDQQVIPAAWTDHYVTGLAQKVYQHTYDILTYLKRNGVSIRWVQIGNEINSGMLLSLGSSNTFANLANFINNGYNAVKSVYPGASVIVHLANGYDDATFRWFFDELVGTTMNDVAARYGKPVMVVERSCPTGWCSFGGVAASISGQAGMVRRPWLAV